MLDKFGNELPPDAPGELTIVGECVGRGYVANEKMTAEKFIKWRGAPAYRSGDMARWGKDGRIYFIGRADNQVKLRGLRIELDEIENVMNTYPSVLRSVVLVKTSEKGEQFLCAWFTANETVDISELKAHISKSLAKYMIPSVFVQLDAIPLTQNGKVDKKALPEPGQTRTGEIRKASTPLQKQLAEMFAKALGVEQVGIDEDFFEMGGTSLLASKVAMQAMVAKLPIAYKDIFAYPTVEELESNILGKSGADTQTQKAVMPAAEETESPEPEELRPALANNTLENVRDIVGGTLGNVLLTGATGFLGIHVLHELIRRGDGKITCLVRRGNSDTPRKRLESMLVYYFETNFADEFDSGRLRTIDGDITDRELVLSQDGIAFDTVINCAACVKHFANDDHIERRAVKVILVDLDSTVVSAPEGRIGNDNTARGALSQDTYYLVFNLQRSSRRLVSQSLGKCRLHFLCFYYSVSLMLALAHSLSEAGFFLFTFHLFIPLFIFYILLHVCGGGS